MTADARGQRPRFLPRAWPGDTGWRLPPLLPYPLDDEALLGSEDPWDRYLFILTRAMQGDFGYADPLVDLFVHEEKRLLHSEIEILAGAILDHEHLRRLFPVIGTKRSFDMSRLARASYWLEFLDPMFGNRFDAELKGLFFSQFVEARDVEVELEYSGPRREYETRVRNRIQEIRAAHPGVQYFLYGEPLHPRLLLDELHEYAREDDEGLWEASASISNALRAFETLTGVPYPQVVFPNEAFGRIVDVKKLPGGIKLLTPDPGGDMQVDRAALDRALAAFDRVDLDRYRPGQRTFFAHAVP